MAANIIYAISIVNDGIQGWAASPTTTTIATVAAPAKDAPFPSVAICPPSDHIHDSWRITSIAYDMLDLVNCKGTDCNTAVLEFRKSFKEFSDKLVDQHLASDEEPSDWQKINEDGTLTKIPGGFWVPEGYKGLKIDYAFRLLYCELAQVLEDKNDIELIAKMTQRLKNAFLGIEEFDLDVLLDEEGIKLQTEGVTPFDVALKKCNVSAEMMKFLGKIYFLNPGAVYKNFGSSMERLMAHGDLRIESWAGSVKRIAKDGSHVVS